MDAKCFWRDDPNKKGKGKGKGKGRRANALEDQSLWPEFMEQASPNLNLTELEPREAIQILSLNL